MENKNTIYCNDFQFVFEIFLTLSVASMISYRIQKMVMDFLFDYLFIDILMLIIFFEVLYVLHHALIWISRKNSLFGGSILVLIYQIFLVEIIHILSYPIFTLYLYARGSFLFFCGIMFLTYQLLYIRSLELDYFLLPKDISCDYESQNFWSRYREYVGDLYIWDYCDAILEYPELLYNDNYILSISSDKS